MDTIQRIRSRYRALFSIQEIEETPILQWLFGAMLFFFFLTFSRFIGAASTTMEAAQNGTALCWPYFQNCADLLTLSGLPHGYTQSAFYMVLYALMLFIVYLMWKREWVHAHFLMLLLFLWKMFVIFVLSYTSAGAYDYYHVILTAILLLVPYKEYFSKLGFVFLYFMSVTPKFDPTWVLGSYFTAMKTGVPLFPDALAPLFSNLVIASQVVGCWFLLSSRKMLQRTALAFFVFFHLYSGILVYYEYPSIALPPLLILFGPLYRRTPTPFTKKALWGVCLLAIVACFQLLGFTTPGDRRVTLEGNRFGMFMFEANHQCIARIRTYTSAEKVASTSAEMLACKGSYCMTEVSTYMDGTDAVRETRYESAAAWSRCDPYPWWTQLNQLCDLNPSIARIDFQFDHSVNGGPFYRIVDERNICSVEYRPFVHNEWIKMPPEAPIIGYPVENVYAY